MPEPSRTSAWQDAFGTIKAFMLKAVNTELSFNDFYNLALGQGLGYRRERMLTDWRSIQGLYKFEANISNIDPDSIIPSRYVTDEQYSVNYNYIAGVEYKYTDAVTGETITGIRMIDSEELASPSDYVNRARELFAAGGVYEDPSARDFKVRFVEGMRP